VKPDVSIEIVWQRRIRSTMAPTKDFTLSALLQHNFLPTQKKDREELPPIFSSLSFLPTVARQLASLSSRCDGWDAVEYRLTRFNGISRPLSIPHPQGYARFAFCVHEHWDNLEYIGRNQSSMVRPREHNDGRIIIMNYERGIEASRRIASLEFAKHYQVHTDIANCFPSIYSHAFPWALVGFPEAKTQKNNKAAWFNQLDQRLRLMKRNETQGIAIGPASSNIVAEAILARVDKQLTDAGFKFVRFIDDYKAFCESEDQAQEFIRRLGELLAQYKLVLNIKKTEVLSLPRPSADDWITALSVNAPQEDVVKWHDANNYLNFALSMSRETPDGSVLKFALKTLSRQKLALDAANQLLLESIGLCFHQPTLLPLLDGIFNQAALPDKFPFRDHLNAIAKENALYRRSDGMCWALYYLNRFGQQVSKSAAEAIIESRDCLSLLLLSQSTDFAHWEKIVNFCGCLDGANPPYELDQYWMLLYQLFLEDKISNPYSGDQAFDLLKANGVSFLKTDLDNSNEDSTKEIAAGEPLEAELVR
jgi:hypothetical protein